MSARELLMALLLLAAAPLAAQQIHTFTETQTGDTLRPIGYPVPVPVASLEAVDGFRDYASLEAKLQALALASADLQAHQVGTTQQYGRPVWAYRTGDADAVDVEGGPEAAFFINAGIHAREWGTQEISTWLLERMVAGADDGAIVRYLLDNTRLVIVPVHNIDGFLQTQRYPTQAIVGRDPRFPEHWPRDGRMRRKNMRGTDEVLESFADHLNGIDLNRNHPQFWATSIPEGSSPNPDDLIYHGTAPHSEAENLALAQALLLAPTQRLRLGIDIHSFAQVFYSSNTGRQRLNAVQADLLARLASHHRSVSRPPGALSGISYRNLHDPANRGMGVLAEYLAYEFLVPAWTLEIEPGSRGARQYGGTNAGHAGFILPDSQVRRVREAWAESHLVAFYFMAGAPHLAQVRIRDAQSGLLVSAQRWLRQGDQRVKVVDAAAPLAPGRRYRLELVFSKPMRVARLGAAPSRFPGQVAVSHPQLVLLGAGQEIALDTAAGDWQPAGERYAYDTYALEFDAPDVAAGYALRVDASDAVALSLDADPSTPVDWVQGQWSGLEDANGTAGDVGGADATTMLQVQDAQLQVASATAVLGEGDRGTVVLRRAGTASGALTARARLTGVDAQPHGVCDALPDGSASWAAGEGGERRLAFCVDDDLSAQGTRSASLQVEVSDDGAAFDSVAVLAVTVLDNDAPGQAVLRVHGGNGLERALDATAGREPAIPVELVLDGSVVHALETGPQLSCNHNGLIAPMIVHGNHAQVRHAANSGDCALLIAGGAGTVELRDLELLGTPAAGPDGTGALLLAASDVVLRRVVLRDGSTQPSTIPGLRGVLLEAHGGALVEQSALVEVPRGSVAGAWVGGDFAVTGSSLSGQEGTALLQAGPGSAGALQDSTLLALPRNASAIALDQAATLRLQGSLLQRDGGAPLCTGAGTPSSSGANIASDSSCGTTREDDHAPVSLDLPHTDPLTGAPFPTGAAIDGAGTGCAAVDIRGAPRPQSTTPGAEALCDVGAVELGSNPYRGLWLPDRPGHGIDIHTAGNILFLTWYSYHPDGTPAAYQASAPLTGPLWRAQLHSARRLEDGSVEVFEAGEIELAFASDIQATLRWRIGDATEWGEEGLQAYFFAEGEPRFETTGTWYAPAESGYGLTVTRRGALTGMVLYYYDGEGVLRWALAQGGDGDVLELPLLGFTGFCPDCDAAANPPQAAPVGTLRVQFLTPQRARLWVDAGYGDGARFVRDAAALVPIGDPVDNRRAAAAAAAQEPASASAVSSDGSR